jgi:hypothetical protein
LGVTKTRDGEPVAPLICHIDGKFGRLVDADNHFSVDSASNKIIRRSEAARFYGAEAQQDEERESGRVNRGFDV